MNRSEKFWDRVADGSDEQGDELDQAYRKTIENSKYHLQVDDIVLDFACGTGIITNEIAADVKEIRALDISSKMIDIAKWNAGERKIENVHFEQTTIFNERYKKELFGVILAFNVLHLLEDAQKVVLRISELIKPGGLFISTTPCLGEKKLLGIFLSLLSKIQIFPYLKLLKTSDIESLIAD
ncbi:MAG: methyltransferase domain-containing protein [Proteobacteria bacterium]|nr:methyltransferase domain-containing protein [Pseudomonadota bacterium]